MKKYVFFLILTVILTSQAFSQGPPKNPISEEDYSKVKGIIENNTPIDNSGKINVTKINRWGGITKAEERIKKINNWIKQNAPWLSLAFGMVPEISFLFILNMYFWLLFFTVFVINAPKEIGDKNKKAINNLRILGFLIFAMLLVSKVYLKISIAIINSLRVLIFDVIQKNFLAIAIAIAVLSIIFAYLIPIISALLEGLFKKIAEVKFIKKIIGKRDEEELEEKVEEIEALTEGIKETGLAG